MWVNRSLLSIVSKAKPKIGAYHFTTIKPNLGVVSTPDQRSFVMADLPGLIEGASDGIGLDINFKTCRENKSYCSHD